MNERVALVTAASSGMGAACARELAGRGYRVALMARSEEVERLAGELDGIGVRGSVESAEDLERFVEAASSRLGRVDVVVANTGHAAKGDLLSLSDEQWHHGLDLLLLHVVRLARLVVPGMIERGGGAFVNISSFAALEPGPNFPISAVVRAGLGAFAKLFAQRHAASGVRMNNILPGWIETYPVYTQELARIPTGRAGRVEEVAKVAAFLVSDDASYVNGESILVDGGLVRAV